MSNLGNVVCKLTTLNQLKQLHAQLIHNSLHNQNYYVSQLINQCCRLHAPPLYTRRIFSSSITPNVFVFTSMLKFLSSSALHRDVLNLFDQMREREIDPDAFVYPVLIKSAGKEAVVFHANVMKLGHANDRYVRNAVMDMYAKYGPIELARRVFDEMNERAAADWNSMISGCWNWGLKDEACRLFDLMDEKNVVTWTAMVTGHCKVNRDVVTARRYFDGMPEKSVVSWNAMLSGYVHNGLAEEALRLFDEMISSGCPPDETTWVTVISSCSIKGDQGLAESLVRMLDKRKIRLNCFVKTALIDMHAKCGNLTTARKIFDELGARRNSVSWNAMISAYARVGDLTSARELFDQMKERNVVSWNSMIAGYAQNGQSAEAIQLFREMITIENMRADEVTMVSVISACGHLGALELGNWAVKQVAANNIELTISGYNSLIYMYSKCGSMKDAQKIFQAMGTRDVVSYNILIAGFAIHGRGIEAVELMLNMKQEGIEPDRVTYIGVLTACSHAGLLEQGWDVFRSITTPSVDHYACMVDLLGRVGKVNEAVNLIESMPVEPHAGVYGSLLNASRLHRKVEIGEYAANKLFQLEPNNSGNYVLLSNIYATAGRWGDVERIRRSMKNESVKKTTGWSWVEYNGIMHKFIVGDRTHERSEDIYRVLRGLGTKMKALGYVADKNCVLRDIEEEEKEEMVGTHSEKLAIGFALLVSEVGAVIRVVKNLRVCGDCHTAIKLISKIEGREILVRDNNRFHCFKDGLCSCKDYW